MEIGNVGHRGSTRSFEISQRGPVAGHSRAVSVLNVLLHILHCAYFVSFSGDREVW